MAHCRGFTMKKGDAMFEIKLCGVCAGYRCAGHDPEVRQANFNREILNQRACSDCCEYAPTDSMTTTPAGNVICAACVKRREAQAGKRAQLSLLGQQSLF